MKQKRKEFGKHEIGDFIILNSLTDLEKEKYKNKVSLQLEIIKNLVYGIAKDNSHPLKALANQYLANN